jgi:hypothetical protein
VLAVLLALAAAALATVATPTAAAPISPCKVLILDTTVSGGLNSIEANEAQAKGCSVDLVNGTQWKAKTATSFAKYRALVLGDPTCGGDPAAMQPAVDTVTRWSPQVTGNVIINGTDPVFHAGSGGEILTRRSIDFAIADATRTGAYISLSCYYNSAPPATPVPVLAGLAVAGGGSAAAATNPFKVRGANCFNNVHITASHPALAGLTDDDLSNWSCSVHEQFESWDKIHYTVLAIALNSGSAYTAPDGTVGTPYILARGKGLKVISDITLTQTSDTAPIGTTHTMTATVVKHGTTTPLTGRNVKFRIVDGPGSPTTGSGTTSSAGKANFNILSNTPGPTTVVASFIDDSGHTQTSNLLTVIWESVLGGSVSRADYRLAGGDSGVFAFGTSKFLGTAQFTSAGILAPSFKVLNAPIVSIAASPSTAGYDLLGGDGGVFAFGDAPFAGSLAATPLAAPAVDIAMHPGGKGYWVLGEDGGVFAFGAAPYKGSLVGIPHAGKAVAIESTPTGLGYWVLTSDGGVFSFGDAKFFGSLAGVALNAPVIAMAASPTGLGYWILTSDGGVFAFGGAPYLGGLVGVSLNAPLVGIAAHKTGLGYWIGAADGGVFAFGKAPFKGTIAGGTSPVPGPGCCSRLNAPIVDIAS